MIKQINDVKPKMLAQIKRSPNQATFGASAVTYNEAGRTYNQIGDIYGGSDRITDNGPKIRSIKDL